MRRVLVVGCGNMAVTWVGYAQKHPQQLEIVALVDIAPQAARALAQRFDLGCPVYTDLETALDAVRPDLVFDITIPSAHMQTSTLCMQAQCDVLGEKPLAETLHEARRSIEVADSTGRQYAIMQNRRYLRSQMAARECVQSGMIGQVGLACADFFIGAHFEGFRLAMQSVLLRDMAIHTFDQARHMLGADAVRVHAQEFNLPGSWYAGSATALCTFQMSNGSVFSYRGSWSAQGYDTAWESNWRVVGDKGTMLWQGDQPPRAQCFGKLTEKPPFIRTAPEVIVQSPYTGAEGHEGCLDDMLQCLEQGRRPMTDCRDNFKSLAMVEAAVESARIGESVDVPQS